MTSDDSGRPDALERFREIDSNFGFGTVAESPGEAPEPKTTT